MVKAILYDQYGFRVGEPTVPVKPSPQVVYWGEEAYVAGCPDDEGRPQYYWCHHFIIPETRENLKFA